MGVTADATAIVGVSRCHHSGFSSTIAHRFKRLKQLQPCLRWVWTNNTLLFDMRVFENYNLWFMRCNKENDTGLFVRVLSISYVLKINTTLLKTREVKSQLYSTCNVSKCHGRAYYACRPQDTAMSTWVWRECKVYFNIELTYWTGFVFRLLHFLIVVFLHALTLHVALICVAFLRRYLWIVAHKNHVVWLEWLSSAEDVW